MNENYIKNILILKQIKDIGNAFFLKIPKQKLANYTIEDLKKKFSEEDIELATEVAEKIITNR